MALTHESSTHYQSYKVGDVKVATYDITWAIVSGEPSLAEPANDSGWFLLNGAKLSRTTYPVLFARFGTNFNTVGGLSDPGVANFRLPNHSEGICPIGKGATNFTLYAASGGEINHTVVSGTGATEIPTHTHGTTVGVTANSHGHTGSAGTDNGGPHTHSYTGPTFFVQASGTNLLTTYQTGLSTSTDDGGHSHTVTSLSYVGNTETFSKSGRISDTAAGAGHNNMMPFIIVGGLLVKYG